MPTLRHNYFKDSFSRFRYQREIQFPISCIDSNKIELSYIADVTNACPLSFSQTYLQPLLIGSFHNVKANKIHLLPIQLKVKGHRPSDLFHAFFLALPVTKSRFSLDYTSAIQIDLTY